MSPPRREPKHAWLGILEKRPQDTGLTFLWFLCPGTVFSLACRAAGALVSLWSHLLSTCVFTTYVLHVSAVDGARRGMSEGQCQQRGEPGVFPSQLPSAPTQAAKLGCCSCCGRSQGEPRAKPLGSLTPVHLICRMPKLWLW